MKQIQSFFNYKGDKKMLNKSKIISIGILGFFILATVLTSGCVDSGTNTTNTQNSDQYSDLQLINAPSVDYYSDGSGGVSAVLVNQGSSTYKNIDVLITCYDESKKVILTKKQGIATLKPGANANIDLSLDNVKTKVYMADVTVVNATKV